MQFCCTLLHGCRSTWLFSSCSTAVPGAEPGYVRSFAVTRCAKPIIDCILRDSAEMATWCTPCEVGHQVKGLPGSGYPCQKDTPVAVVRRRARKVRADPSIVKYSTTTTEPRPQRLRVEEAYRIGQESMCSVSARPHAGSQRVSVPYGFEAAHSWCRLASPESTGEQGEAPAFARGVAWRGLPSRLSDAVSIQQRTLLEGLVRRRRHGMVLTRSRIVIAARHLLMTPRPRLLVEATMVITIPHAYR